MDIFKKQYIESKEAGSLTKVSFKKNSDIFTEIYLQSEIEKNFEGLLPKT